MINATELRAMNEKEWRATLAAVTEELSDRFGSGVSGLYSALPLHSGGHWSFDLQSDELILRVGRAR